MIRDEDGLVRRAAIGVLATVEREGGPSSAWAGKIRLKMVAQDEVRRLGECLLAEFPSLADRLAAEGPVEVAIRLLSQKPEPPPVMPPPGEPLSNGDMETRRLLIQHLGASNATLHNDILQQVVHRTSTRAEIDSLRASVVCGWEAFLMRLRLTEPALAFDLHCDPPNWIVACGGGPKREAV